MLGAAARKMFGSSNDRQVRKFRRDVGRINALEEEVSALSDDALAAKTGEFRSRLEAGETLDALLPEAFAVVREAAKRTLGMRHFDVQLIGGMALHKGMIAEMKTGEGKTLVATLPVYLNALSGKGVHVVTVNDYLAHRDAEWMGQVYRFLGLSVGCIVHGLDDDERKAAYAADVTYGTNNEFGFDYLRGNMKFTREEMAQRPFHYAIVDEVDSILVDEARTPLIISGPTEDNSALYVEVDKIIPQLTEEDYDLDEKARAVTLSEAGTQHAEELLTAAGTLEEGTGLYDIANVSVVHHLNQALRAHKLFTAEVDYIVKDGKVIIIDEFTGRMMEGRRYSEGLHQALEAKESVPIQNENQTLASITFQNYFRLYPKLAGMTGTAMTEAGEFADIYGLHVLEIPTHRPVTRVDRDDVIYRTEAEKFDAVIALIEDCHTRGQPALVGTVSIEKSEYLSKVLKKHKIPHNVLNAKQHEKEAHIIAQAGAPGAVTIATNMAGRGTDIMLGGNPEMMEDGKNNDTEAAKAQVIEAGGLYVIGTERHESRRIDNQLRGRSGRQGDPGASKFFLSMEDDLMRIFGGERMSNLLSKLGMEEGEALHHPLLNRSLERAQKKVEARNYEIRKNLLKFDDVMNDQRKVVYEQRIDLMEAEDLADVIEDMRESVVAGMVATHIPKGAYTEDWDAEGLQKETFRVLGVQAPVAGWAAEEGIAEVEIEERLQQAASAHMAAKEEMYGEMLMRAAEKRILLQTLDELWKEHLYVLDHLRQGINLRAYGQRDPLNEYKREAFVHFNGMLEQLKEVVTERLSLLTIHAGDPAELAERDAPARMRAWKPDAEALEDGNEVPGMTVDPVHRRVDANERDPADPATWGRVGRNEPCPCGSGKKYKHCHGQW